MLRILPLLVFISLSACSRTPAATTAETGTSAAGATSTDAALAGGVPPGAFSTAAAQGTPQAAAKPVPAELPDIVARVNGEAITRAQIENAVRGLEASAGSAVPADQRDRVYRDLLDRLIGYKLLIQETKTRKLAVPDAELEAQIAGIRAQFPSEEAFQQTLQQQNVTLEKLRADALDDLLVSKMMDAEIGPKAAATPEQLTDFYQKNPSQFQQGERVRASHILIGFPQNADEAAKVQVRAKAAEILKEVKAGKDFAALAKEHSTDTGSGSRGGDLDYFERGQMVPPFEQAAFALQTGQTSDLVESNFGVHIIRLTDRQPPRTVPLDEVRPQLQQFIENQNRQEMTLTFVSALRAKAMIEVLI